MAWTAGDQLPLCRRAADGRQPRDLQERHQGDGASARVLGHLHGQAGPHLDRELVSRAFEPVEGRPQHVRRRIGDFPPVPPPPPPPRPAAPPLPRPPPPPTQPLPPPP